MNAAVIGIVLVVSLFLLILLFIFIGQRLGKITHSTRGLSVTEGAVFTLMAFLVALTFSSATQRFDERRAMITEETNAIGTAYLRLDLLQPADKRLVQQDMKEYISARLAIYEALPDLDAANIALEKSQQVQAKLWLHVMDALKNPAVSAAPILIVPALNSMFDIAHTRTMFSYFHPHYMIFVLLIIVMILSGLMVGYDMAEKKSWSTLHVLIFSSVITATVYIIIDLEFPRFGMIQETAFDQQLMDLKKQMTLP